MHLYCVFLDQKVKILISYLKQEGVSRNMAAITQHAIVEKRASEGMVFPFFFPLLMFWLELKAYAMPHMCCEMQNKLSKTRVSPLWSMG